MVPVTSADTRTAQAEAGWPVDHGAPPPLCLRQGWRFRASSAEGLQAPTFPKDGINPQKRPQVPFEIQETTFSEQLLSRHKKSFQDKSRLSCLSGKYKACSRPFKSKSVIRTRFIPRSPRRTRTGGDGRLLGRLTYVGSGWASWGPQAFGGICMSAYCVLCPVLGLGDATVNKTEMKRKLALVLDVL